MRRIRYPQRSPGIPGASFLYPQRGGAGGTAGSPQEKLRESRRAVRSLRQGRFCGTRYARTVLEAPFAHSHTPRFPLRTLPVSQGRSLLRAACGPPALPLLSQKLHPRKPALLALVLRGRRGQDSRSFSCGLPLAPCATAWETEPDSGVISHAERRPQIRGLLSFSLPQFQVKLTFSSRPRKARCPSSHRSRFRSCMSRLSRSCPRTSRGTNSRCGSSSICRRLPFCR